MSRTIYSMRSVTALAILLLAAGCATTGSTLGSGVGERLVDSPPYYSGSRQAAVAGRVVHLPIAYQAGAAQSPIFDPGEGAGTPTERLIAEMNVFLDGLGGSRPIIGADFSGTTAPDVRFGCDTTPFDECIAESEDVSVQGAPWHELAVGRPSESWTTALRHGLSASTAEHAIVITLEVGQYWPIQRNLRGDKVVYLGAGHTQSLPWLTSLDRPVQVLQLTGALVDRDGRAVRIGAEGVMARSTNIVASGFGLEALITDEEVERARTATRSDLPGSPLTWQVALTNLVAQLTGEALGVR